MTLISHPCCLCGQLVNHTVSQLQDGLEYSETMHKRNKLINRGTLTATQQPHTHPCLSDGGISWLSASLLECPHNQMT